MVLPHRREAVAPGRRGATHRLAYLFDPRLAVHLTLLDRPGPAPSRAPGRGLRVRLGSTSRPGAPPEALDLDGTSAGDK